MRKLTLEERALKLFQEMTFKQKLCFFWMLFSAHRRIKIGRPNGRLPEWPKDLRVRQIPEVKR